MNTRRHIRAIICSGAAAMLLPGCQHASNPLVGKWKANLSQLGQSTSMMREFRDDGTETMVFGKSSAQTLMTYRVDGQTITENITGMSIEGKTVASSPAATGLPKDLKETFSVNGDKLTLISKQNGVNVNMTYDRVQ